MDFWILITKLTLLIYIAVISVLSDVEHMAWMVLAMLGYFCVNITLYIFHSRMIQRVLLLFSIMITFLASVTLDSLFMLLLPLAIIEFFDEFIQKKIVLFVLSAIPILYLDPELKPAYALISILSFILYTIVSQTSSLLIKNEAQLDTMRKDLQRLTKRLNENSEFIRQSEYTFRLEERNRISQEIHDKIGHSMTGALFQMEAAKRVMDKDKAMATELLQNAINISKDGIENIRLTLKNMKPPSEQVGLHRLKLMIDEYNAKHSMKSLLTHEGNLDFITPLHWKIIHENITEALTNAMKYSSATFISIDIKVLNKLIRVEVKDNGTGSMLVKKGLGILGMEERTASVNGKMIVDGTNGFSVTTLLPLPE